MRTRTIHHRDTESQRNSLEKTQRLGFSVPLCLCGEVSVFRCIRPLLIPVAQHELAVAFGIALITEHSQPIAERPEKLLAVAFLHLLGLASRFRRGLPLVNLSRNFNRSLPLEGRILSRRQQRFHAP